jgi:parallel beta-helix repeat protein
MDRCFQNEASDNFISGTQFSQGLMFRMCKGVTARNNILINNGEVKYFERNRITGIIAWDSSDIIMERNFVTGSSSDGLGVAVSNEEKAFNKNFASYNAKISYNVSVVNGEQGIWIEGLTNGEIDHNYIVGNTNIDPRSGSSGIMLELENLNIKIHDNFIKSNEIAGISLHSSTNNEIYRNFISSNKGPGISIENQPSNYFNDTPSDNNYIHNNVITKNAYGVIVQNGTNNRFVNNTLSADYGDPFIIYKGVKSTLIANNIVNGSVNQQIYDQGASTVIVNNLLYGTANKSTAWSILSKSLVVDPQFINPKIEDFRLKSKSPARLKANMKYSSCAALPKSTTQKDLGAYCLPW